MSEDEIHELIAAAIRSEMGDGMWDARDAGDLASALMAHAIPLIIADATHPAEEAVQQMTAVDVDAQEAAVRGRDALRAAVERLTQTAPTLRFVNDYPVNAVPVSDLLSVLAVVDRMTAAPTGPEPRTDAAVGR